MSSPAQQPTFILIRRLDDGRIEWVPLEFVPPQRVPVAPDSAYTLVDRADYEAPKTLEAQRRGNDLVVEVQGTEVLVLEGFFATADVAFYPTTNIAGGAGPFSGSPLTADSSVPAASSPPEQVVWSAAADERGEETSAAAGTTGAASQSSGGSSPLLWVGLGAGGLGLLALAGGGGGSGGGESGGQAPVVPSGPVADTVPPQITSGAAAPAIAENSGPGQVVYTATATDAGTITYSLKAGDDAAAFSINATTGAVTLAGNPDFEAKPSYTFTVVATDGAGNSTERAVSLDISNVNDSGSIAITSGATATAINENSGAQQVIYTVTATGTGAVTYSLKSGGDAAAFSINASTGAVTLTANPDDEAKGSYSFTVVAKDAAGNSSERAVSLGINDVDEVAPTITSGATATAINENSGAGQVVYTATSTDTGDIGTGNTTYSLKPVGDSSAFSINAATGAVRLTGNPDFEAKPSYSFTVVATDAAQHSSERAVSLAINNVNESSPITITSGATATAINENSGAQQVVYTVTATGAGAVTYSLKAGGDAAAFSIDAITGAVTLTANPDDEAKGSYGFTVVARDAAGNTGERAVSLGINDLDEVAPTITSSATATAINENSGAGQVVYTVTSTDTGDISTGSTTYSLKAGGDAAAFSMDTNTGAVRLTANPDFETKSNYNFTVVATDAAQHSSERAVSLAIGNVAETVDETSPTVDHIALSAVGAQNGVLNAGDTVRVTVTMSENTQVDTSGGTPSIELSIDHDRVDAGYVSGSGTPSLIFEYTIQPGDEDKNGISIRANSLDRNGSHIADLAGNEADLRHDPVANNPSFVVDTSAPSSSSDNTTLTFETSDLIVGLAGLADLSPDMSRTFESAVSEQIDIRDALVDTTLSTARSVSGIWSGPANLGSDDRVVLAGNGAESQDAQIPANQISNTEGVAAWPASPDSNEGLQGSSLANSTHLGTSMPAGIPDGGEAHANAISFANMPIVIVTSQGLV